MLGEGINVIQLLQIHYYVDDVFAFIMLLLKSFRSSAMNVAFDVIDVPSVLEQFK